jgi:hypothetical protein
MPHESTQSYQLRIVDEKGEVSNTIVFGTSPKDNSTGYFSTHQIHIDDSIRTIKCKILLELHQGKYTESIRLNPVYEELYLYAKTRHGKWIPIGITQDSKNPDFDANPYQVIKKEDRENLTYNDASLLLNYGTIEENTLYLCVASRVIDDENEEYVFQYYYPFLYSKQISSVSELTKKRASLMTKTRDMLNDGRIHLYDSVNTFYKIHREEKSLDIPYLVNGIPSVVLKIENPESSVANLETIFKLLHASKLCPFIKFNPGNRRENLYRFYFERTSRNGKKIPYLSKTHLSKLAKDTGKSQQISVYVSRPEFAHVYLHFAKTGELFIECKWREPVSEKELDRQLTEFVNPVIQSINRDLHQIGFSVGEYTHIREVEVVSMEYVLKTTATKKAAFEKIPCIYSICTLNEETPGQVAVARIKRVENFREMDAANALIYELYSQVEYGDAEIGDIVDTLVHRKLATNMDAALLLISEFLSNRTEMSVEKPGFLLTMNLDVGEKVLEYRVKGITSAFYLEPLFVYLDAFVKLTQHYTPKNMYWKQLTAICSKKYVQDEHQEPAVLKVNVSKPLVLENADEDFFSNLVLDESEEEEEYVIEPDVLDETGEESDVEWAEEVKPKLVQKPIAYEDSEDESETPEKGPDTPIEPEPPAPKKGPIMYDDESEEEEEESMEGGDQESSPERLVPDGMPLKNPNPFLKRLQKRDPTLFFTNPTGKFSGYSTSCQPVSRHPVILTQEEMDKMPEGSYTHSIKYGSDPKKPHYFVCPRFWCFLTDSAISEEDVKAGKCGKIIPKGATEIPKGAYVYELSDKDQIPSYQLDAHPDGHCLPCCFKKPWDSKSQKETRAKCSANANAVTTAKPIAQKTAQYIISLDTYPVPEKRWGFLPLPVQLFLNMDYSSAIDPNNPAVLVKGKPVLLRYGVENPPKQSFLGFFADLYARHNQLPSTPSVQEFREILAKMITLDLFVSAHKGSLLSTFLPRDKKTVALEKYKDSEFAKPLDLAKPEQKSYFEDAVNSYESFLAFLRDTSVPIDHTYLWDFVCELGVNLAIMEIKSNDMLERIELVCPSNLYSEYQFDSDKETCLVLKHGEFYEPVFLFESNGINPPTIVSRFSEKTLHKNIQTVLRNVEHLSLRHCPALPSLPRIYTFLNATPLTRIYTMAESLGAKVESQVSNYQGKTIALMLLAKDADKSVWVPCEPSARKKNVPVEYMDNTDLWRDYATTKQLLSNFQLKIPCRPVWKLRENKMIVGFLTETNQFVPIQPNENTIEDDIRLYEGVNHVLADKAFSTRQPGDKERIKNTKFIQLESEFYYVFRNKMRALINAFVNESLKTQIQNDTNIDSVETLLQSLAEGHIVFVDIAEDVLLDLADINECVDTATPYCIIKENGASQLTLPKHNLLSKYDNEDIYFGRLADELVRNERVKSFFYDTKTRISAKSVEYSIRSDEMVLPQSAITNEYFAELDPHSTNAYITNTNYETAVPSIHVTYPKESIPLSEQYAVEDDTIPPEFNKSCINRVTKVIGNKIKIWKRVFPDTAKEIVFQDTPECTFTPFISILSAKLGKDLNLQDFKHHLLAAYTKMSKQVPENLGKMCSIMRKQGKSKMFELFARNRETLTISAFEAVVMSDTYYMTDMDVWVLSTEYGLPIILFNPNGLKGFVTSDIEWLKVGGNMNDEYHFVRSMTGSKVNIVYPYHLITPAFRLSSLKELYTIIQKSITDKSISTWPLIEMLRRTEFVPART